MASDDAYAAFLNKANEDPSTGYAQSAGTASISLSAEAVKNAPAVLVSAVEKNVFYTSDTDEPFSAFGVPLKGSQLPDEDAFVASVVGSKAGEVTILDPSDWDRKGKYTELLEAVREAGKGNDVRVYRVQLDGTRVEYYLVTVSEGEEGAKLVGVRTLAVES